MYCRRRGPGGAAGGGEFDRRAREEVVLLVLFLIIVRVLVRHDAGETLGGGTSSVVLRATEGANTCGAGADMTLLLVEVARVDGRHGRRRRPFPRGARDALLAPVRGAPRPEALHLDRLRQSLGFHLTPAPGLKGSWEGRRGVRSVWRERNGCSERDGAKMVRSLTRKNNKKMGEQKGTQRVGSH